MKTILTLPVVLSVFGACGSRPPCQEVALADTALLYPAAGVVMLKKPSDSVPKPFGPCVTLSAKDSVPKP